MAGVPPTGAPKVGPSLQHPTSPVESTPPSPAVKVPSTAPQQVVKKGSGDYYTDAELDAAYRELFGWRECMI